MSPETYNQGIYVESSAIYSIAMLAYFAMNGMCPPFWADTDEALAQRFSGKQISRPEFADKYSNLWRVIEKALSFSPADRPHSFEEFISLLDVIKKNQDEISSVESSESHNISCPDDTLRLCDDFAATCRSMHADQRMPDRDTFASTCFEMRCADNRLLNDLFASTTTQRRNSGRLFSELNDSYQPQKKSTVTESSPTSRKRKWWHFWKEDDDHKTETVDEVSACVYAPAQIQPMKTFIIRIYLYKPEEADEIETKVSSIDPGATKKDYKPLDIPVKENDRLTVQLKMSEGIVSDAESKTVIWKNHFTECCFMAKLTDRAINDVFGTAYIFLNGVPAGELLFTIDVVDTLEKSLFTKVESRRYSRIFISYSHADEMQVRGFAECCRAIGTDYFFDRHTLQPGDLFKDKILNYINNADLFVLCWSKNAAESEWVRIEREHALSLIREPDSKSSIYPLNLKPEAPLPLDMSDKYNFGTL